MATETIEFKYTSTLTLTAVCYPQGSDTAIHAAANCTEATNRKGCYTFTNTTGETGRHDVFVLLGTVPVLSFQVDLTGTAITVREIRVADAVKVSGTSQTARDLGLALPAVVAGGKGGLPITDASTGLLLTGYGGATLKNDLIDAPNATAVTAIQLGLSKPNTAQTITANQAVNVAQWLGSTAPANTGDAYALALSMLDYNGRCRIADGPTSSQIQFGTDASSDNDFYNGAAVKITGGTGVNQSRRINSYVGSTRIATLDSAWVTAPDGTSTVIVLGRIIT